MNRVVVTGIGVMAPGSIGKAALWENLSAAEVCTGPIELPAYEELRVKIAGRIENFLEKDYLSDQNGINFREIAKKRYTV